MCYWIVLGRIEGVVCKLFFAALYEKEIPFSSAI